jgi:hypothetical protein
LARNKSVDEFWVPLLALYSGARLGEVTDLNLEDIGIDADSGVPYMQIGTKNENSVRKVPIHDTLIEMGFLDIVEHVKSLGSTRLYPHRPLNQTRIENSGKLMSRNFGAFLDVVGIESSQLVFHSFRHTAITRMHVRHVPVAEAELIVGHASQDNDVRNSAGRSQFKSTHLGTYVHPADFEDPDYPLMARLKGHLHMSLYFSIDVPRLTKAAKIVLEHMKVERTKDVLKFKSGWHTNKTAYSELMTKRLDD